MPESFAQGRCLGYLMMNSMRKASCQLLCFLQSRSLRKAHWEGQRSRCPIRRRTGNEDVAPPVRLNPARSSQSQFQETIVPRVPLCYQQSVKHKAQRPHGVARRKVFRMGSTNLHTSAQIRFVVICENLWIILPCVLCGKRHLHVSAFLHFYTAENKNGSHPFRVFRVFSGLVSATHHALRNRLNASINADGWSALILRWGQH